MRIKNFSAIVIFCLLGCSQNKTLDNGLTPKETLAGIVLPDGFNIELFASEPMIADPVAMEIDEYGDIYVVEMHGYPEDTAGSGIIKLLTDTDKDGKPDKSTVFADHLKLPTGIMKWKKGVLVTDVPDIIYLEDSDKDGKADIRKTLLTGLALTNPQHTANTPVYGIDNWIYIAHMGSITPKVSMIFTDTGSSVRYTGAPTAAQLPRNADGRNIRLKPDSDELEMMSGESQYGHTFDEWGHHFCVENADHIFYEAIEAKYLSRNPDLLVADASDYISDHGDACEVYPVTLNPENQLLTDRGVVTSACGITWYQGGLFPDSFNNITFTAEPVSNIIHADKIKNNGASFIASAMYAKKEFFAAKDAWCRPVQMYIGPDGALYVIDYYRKIIEHPEWLSEEVIKSGELYKGSDKGRIYRITPANKTEVNKFMALPPANASTAELVQMLASKNIWWRRTAQRLLMDKKDTAAVSLLQSMADTVSNAVAAVHALWILDGYKALDASTLIKALHHNSEGVRENAIKIAEKYLHQFPELEQQLISLQNDVSEKVRFRLLCTLGEIKTITATNAMQRIFIKDIEDRWVQVAALGAFTGNEMKLLEECIALFGTQPSEGKALFFANCAGVIGLSQKQNDIKKIIALSTAKKTNAGWWQSACLKGLEQAFAVKGIPSSAEEQKNMLLSQFTAKADADVRSAALELLGLLGAPAKEINTALVKARTILNDNNEDADLKKDALQLIAIGGEKTDTAIIADIVTNTNASSELRQSAIQVLNKIAPQQCNNIIIAHWNQLPVSVQDEGIKIFLSSAENMQALLTAVEKKIIQTTSISWPQKVELMNNEDAVIRNRSRKLLAPEIENREAVYKNYQAALTTKGDAAKGKLVFTKACGTCHQYQGNNGVSFGPDLGSIKNRDAASIMSDVLNPNRSIAVTYEMWTVTKLNGEKITGIKSAETPAAIKLKQIGNKQVTIARNQIKMMEASQTSAMPVGLEGAISVTDMANLIAFIKGQ